MKALLFWIFGLVWIVCAGARASSAQTLKRPAFEIASIKPNRSVSSESTLDFQPGGRFTSINVPLGQLIRVAFGIPGSQLMEGPDWIRSERFDVLAKAEGNPPPPSSGPPGLMQQMIQTLLIERFKLAVHTETRDVPTFALTIARADRRLGPQLHLSTLDCATILVARERGAVSPDSRKPGERPTCAMLSGGGRYAAGGITMEQFARTLSLTVDRPVVDRTELRGFYEFEIAFTTDELAPSGPSIFTALQEQLGLKLESTKGPVDVLVIDHVEQPTPD